MPMNELDRVLLAISSAYLDNNRLPVLRRDLAPELGYRGMHLTPEAPTYSMRAHGGLPAYAGGV